MLSPRPGLPAAEAGARKAELRLPEAGALPGWIWRLCFVAIGVLLLFYREA